jgi:hypothetical protein
MLLNEELAAMSKDVAMDCFKDTVHMKSAGTDKMIRIVADTSTDIPTGCKSRSVAVASSTGALGKRRCVRQQCIQRRCEPAQPIQGIINTAESVSRTALYLSQSSQRTPATELLASSTQLSLSPGQRFTLARAHREHLLQRCWHHHHS